MNHPDPVPSANPIPKSAWVGTSNENRRLNKNVLGAWPSVLPAPVTEVTCPTWKHLDLLTWASLSVLRCPGPDFPSLLRWGVHGWLNKFNLLRFQPAVCCVVIRLKSPRLFSHDGHCDHHISILPRSALLPMMHDSPPLKVHCQEGAEIYAVGCRHICCMLFQTT